MDEQQNYAKSIQQRLFKEVLPELEKRRKMTSDADILAKYDEIDARVKDVSKGLDEVIVQGMVPEFDESLPKALGEKNSVLDDKSVGFKAEILGVYEEDVKKRINGFYNKIVDVYNQSKADVNSYRDNFGVFGQRLAMIKTLFDIEKDDRVIEMKKDIEDKTSVFSRLPRPVDQQIYGPYFSDILPCAIHSGRSRTHTIFTLSGISFEAGILLLQDLGLFYSAV